MMRTILAADRPAMGQWVATQAAEVIRTAIEQQGHATIVIATGASQFEVLGELVQQPNIDWSLVTGFHLDEYVGLSADHPASFCRYLKERFVDLVPISKFHFLYGDQDASETIAKTGAELQKTTIDLALVGIGENAHLAFNDPPADFETLEPYLIVKLDEACRKQQVGEGWFPSLEDVPTEAMSMSVQQILKAKRIFCSVPDSQKATAVRQTLEGGIDPMIPASILKQHAGATLIIDRASAGQLSQSTLDEVESIA
ncbi:Glucosamine-6-phosphate deaminase 1 [Novipirellula galeiformis]|uniref:Glucosamine-6-phosphate deaminase 1 n=1 Tax=Novipirellula galeiformis TaxID=2528004 RepID=A0A5C6CRU3_9BACT|nr:glucosamine-6-phosphate deaminase [Novipirellula galeiformis]TWU26181.1 Glucosamine-6-phosphate deaminase 1 [Novipirellula galeiformis]